MFRLIKFELKKILNIKRIILIFLIVFLSSFALIKFSEYLYNSNNNTYFIPIDYESVIARGEIELERLKNQYANDQTPNNLWQVKRQEVLINSYKYFNSKGLASNDWRGNISTSLQKLSLDEIPLNMYLDGVDMSELTATTFGYTDEESVRNRLAEIQKEKNQLKDIFENGSYYNYIETLIKSEKESLNSIEDEIGLVKSSAVLPNYTAVSRLKDLTREKNVIEAKLKVYNYIIENQIKDQNDWRYVVCNDIIDNLYYQYLILDTKEEFQYNHDNGTVYLSYEEYINLRSIPINEAKTKNQKNWYYLENNIKPLTLSTNEFSLPYTTRLSMNNVYFMGIIALIITAIMCGGIVANEHKTGSIRLLLTKPFKKYKILLSKLLVMLFIFLFTYLIGIITTYLLSGIMYGFSDFSIPLLVNNYGSIGTISYLTFTYNNILKTISIMILFLSILFALSSITLNTPISLSIILILIFILMFLPYVITFNSIFNYIPLVLLNFHEAIFPTRVGLTNIDVNSAIIWSIIYNAVILVITFIVYCKRDVKN